MVVTTRSVAVQQKAQSSVLLLKFVIQGREDQEKVQFDIRKITKAPNYYGL